MLSAEFPDVAETGLVVALPEKSEGLSQDREWFLVRQDEKWVELRLHDYAEIYSIEGLYEKVVYDLLECHSPEVIRDLLEEAMQEAGCAPSELDVLDLGAGNGIMAEELQKIGAERFVGADLLPEAAMAAERDRPGLYDDYVVGDITDLPGREEKKLDEHDFNCLTCVAALGFGDIPPKAFVTAFNQISDGGWIAFCIKRDFVSAADRSGFSQLIERMMRDGTIEVCAKKPYVHRKSLSGRPLEYVAYIARKRREIAIP